MFHSADEIYDDEITSGPYECEKINFEATAAEQYDDARLPDPLDELGDEE